MAIRAKHDPRKFATCVVARRYDAPRLTASVAKAIANHRFGFGDQPGVVVYQNRQPTTFLAGRKG